MRQPTLLLLTPTPASSAMRRQGFKQIPALFQNDLRHIPIRRPSAFVSLIFQWHTPSRKSLIRGIIVKPKRIPANVCQPIQTDQLTPLIYAIKA